MGRSFLTLCLAAFVTSCAAGDVSGSKVLADDELIILAAPQHGDPYYADVYDDIISFQIEFARQIIDAGDDVIILSDEGGLPLIAAALGREHVSHFPVEDIWARDYGASNAVDPVFFRYTSEGQGGGVGGQSDADAVQDAIRELAIEAELDIGRSNLFNDGGNFVDSYAGSVVISRKFLRDNGLTENDGRAAIRQQIGVSHVAFIEADEQGGLEHADGVVAFVSPTTLIINSYPDDPRYAASLRADLENGLPDIQIIEVPTPYDASEIYDERFGSACGLYTNALVTPHRIYLPQFGIPEDEVVLERVRSLTSRDVIPVPSSLVCHMGGGVRCMSWQLRGENARLMAEFLRHDR